MLRKVLALICFGIYLRNNPGYCEDRLSLPTNKSAMVNCQEAALSLHPGSIDKEKTVRTWDGNVEIHLEINDKARHDWHVVCSGLTGKILKQINLED